MYEITDQVETAPGETGETTQSIVNSDGNTITCIAKWRVSAHSPSPALFELKAVTNFFDVGDGIGTYYYEEMCQLQYSCTTCCDAGTQILEFVSLSHVFCVFIFCFCFGAVFFFIINF